MAEPKKIHVTVVTPDRTVLDEDAAAVVVPAFDGEWAVLPGHAAFLALLGCGRLRVSRLDGTPRLLAVQGGFLQVKDNAVTVLTPAAAGPEDLDGAAVDEELRALKAEHPAEAQREAHAGKLAWAQARRKVLDSGMARAWN